MASTPTLQRNGSYSGPRSTGRPIPGPIFTRLSTSPTPASSGPRRGAPPPKEAAPPATAQPTDPSRTLLSPKSSERLAARTPRSAPEASLPSAGNSPALSSPPRASHQRSLSQPSVEDPEEGLGPVASGLTEKECADSSKRSPTPTRTPTFSEHPSLGSPRCHAKNADRVQVAVRIRPYDPMADGPDPTPALEVDGAFIYPRTPKYERQGRAFHYDYVFTNTQEEVYEGIGKSMLQSFLQGYNVCLFAYGQTGSGKTYSMMGTPAAEGIIPRLCKDLMQHNEERLDEYPNLTIKISLSYIEIYNEKVRDLLERHLKGDELTSRSLYERDGKVYVRGLSRHQVLNYSKIAQLIAVGNARRQTSPTNMNETSSRSHSILQLTMTQTYDPPEAGCRDVESTITLVDLAGSERISKAELTGLSVEESKNINQSLLCLGRALNHFSQQHGEISEKVPFLRSSKLTRLLSDCFGGNSRTWMLATASPSVFNVTETVCTLDYAKSAKQILNAAKVNRLERAVEVKELQEKVRRLNEEIDRLLAESNRNAEAQPPRPPSEDSAALRLHEQLQGAEAENAGLQAELERHREGTAALQAAVATHKDQLDKAHQQLQTSLQDQLRVLEENRALAQRLAVAEDQLARQQAAERTLREALDRKQRLLEEAERDNEALQQRIEDMANDFEEKLLDIAGLQAQPPSPCSCSALHDRAEPSIQYSHSGDANAAQEEVTVLQRVAALLSTTLSERQRELLAEHQRQLLRQEEDLGVGLGPAALQTEVNTLSGQLSGSREEVFRFIEENLRRENQELRERNAVLLRLLNEQSESQLLNDQQRLLDQLLAVVADRDQVRGQLKALRDAHERQAQQLMRLLMERGGTSPRSRQTSSHTDTLA